MRLSLTALAVIAIGCTPAEETAPALVAPQQARFIASEFAFSGPDSLAPGITTFRLENEGEQAHHFMLAKLEEGRTMDDVMAMMEAGEPGVPEWLSFRGAAGAIETGGSTGTTIDLVEGNYVAICFIPDPADGVPHLVKGMTKEITVSGERHLAEAPVADAEIRMSDYEFAVDSVGAGPHTFMVTNDGVEPHEVEFMRLNDGATVDDLMAAMQPDFAGEFPATSMGGTGALTSGMSSWWSVDLEPGNYVMICFVPGPDDIPHFAMGMVRLVTVS